MSDKTDEELDKTLALQGCKNINPDNPGRVAVSITYLYNVLKASEKFIHDFTELMIWAGKAKKEGLHPTDMVHTVEKQIAELNMWTKLARSQIGDINNEVGTNNSKPDSSGDNL